MSLVAYFVILRDEKTQYNGHIDQNFQKPHVKL